MELLPEKRRFSSIRSACARLVHSSAAIATRASMEAMPMADDFLPPLAIPWTLAATTQPLAPFEPADNAISIFWYLPDDKALTSELPNDRLVYLKFAVTVSPAPVPPGVPFPAGFALGDRIPCFH